MPSTLCSDHGYQDPNKTQTTVTFDQTGAAAPAQTQKSPLPGRLSRAILIAVNLFVAANSVPLYRTDLRDTVWTDPSSILDGVASVWIAVGLWVVLSFYVWTSIATLTAILNRDTAHLRPLMHLYLVIAAIHFGAFGLGACLDLVVPSPPADPSVIY